ncbi:hypothetical protein IFM47457_05776 [Aspergillus lentulus]|uniref:HNH nuclease domain-containing protein n=1 Tax=Aspergillus lentulus TaxID=293939 RepID=A0ABQ0ZZ44_ASPLE|nr:hypothetical protein IFM60648_02980 [Aspergillus lentulus]GFF82356.1 hypothetical protein IFM47457_05776 [Aspergillus lentulus]
MDNIAGSYVQILELQDLAKQFYPGLSPEEAYLALNDQIATALEPILKMSPEIAELVGLIFNLPLLERRAQGAALLKIILPIIFGGGKKDTDRTQHTAGNRGAGAVDSVPAQIATKILEGLRSDTLKSSSFVSQDTMTTAAGASATSANVQSATGNTTASAQSSCGTSASLFEHMNYKDCVQTALATIQVIQGYQVVQALNAIADNLGDSNAITVSGSGGPNGFAQHVYDLIVTKINDVDEDNRKNHRFFVYNPDTIWYPAFTRLTQEKPLPREYLDKGDNLDHMCLFMREVRTKLNGADPEHAKDVVFHLLIPSWYRLGFRMPLHFPEDLYPLQIEGLKNAGGKEVVEMNLPEAPVGLLHGVANVPRHWDKTAEVASAATWILEKLSGFHLKDEVYEAIREEGARVLGSNERLKRETRVIPWEIMQQRILSDT